jgi:integrase
MIVPASAPCHIDGDTVPCGSCEEDGEFTTKYDDRRRIPLVETWNNWNRGSHDTYETESINLPERVKNYFKVTEDDYGNAMIAGDGVTSKTINRWVKQIADDADIGLERGYTQIATLEDPVPDVFPHDMRGTFIMQLIRNNMHRTKLIKYTGHDLVSSLAPYESRVASETDAREFLDHI